MKQGSLRILVVTSTFPRWKDDTEPSFVFDLCKYLHNKGINVDVLAPHAKGAEKFEILDNIKVYRYQYFLKSMQNLSYKGGILENLKKHFLNYILVPFFMLAQIHAVYKRLNSADYHLIHAHWLIPQGFACSIVRLISRKNSPSMICTSHGGDLYALNNFIFNRLKIWVINNCAGFCVVSNAMKSKVLEFSVAEEKICVMPMGVDLNNVFKPVPGIARVKNRLIFVGRLVEKKGVSILIEAMIDVVKKVPEAELLIIGDGPLRTVLEKQAEQLKLNRHVNFHGSVRHDHLPELYSSASIAVVPSIIAVSGDQEGLGLVIIEAMGCQCAVVASSLEAIRDVVDDKTGFLVAPENSTELARTICMVLENDDLRLSVAEKGQEKALAAFDWDIAGDRYFQLIHSLCS